jgi:hypothetical protein
MIDALDRTLERFLSTELPDDLVSQVTISFAAPDDQFPPTAVSLPAIDLFLYDVRENRELRSNEFAIERSGDGNSATKKRPPARIDCSYLVTAWASESAPNPAQDEHRLLGEAMKVLLRHRKIPDEFLQGSLAGQEPPVRALPLQPGQLQSLGEFWQALGGKPKAALNYTLTVTVDLFAQEEVRLVGERVVDLKQIREAAEAP